MTGGEKQDIYNLLKKASSWAYGYTPSSFEESVSFADDIEAVLPKETPVSAQNNPSDSQTVNPSAGQSDKQAAPLTQSNDLQKSMAAGSKLAQISTKILTCRNCVLCQQRKNAVPGEGVVTPVVMVIGEGPGEDEDIQGRPFVGKAGQLLDKMLNAIELDRTVNCYIANIVKCRPPLNRTPMPDEAAACRGYLEAQIHALKPVMILAMGRTSVQNLMQTGEGINALRGKFLEYHLGGNENSPAIPLMATYHPSALLRDPGLKRPAWEDLKSFRAKLTELVPDYNVSFKEKFSNNS